MIKKENNIDIYCELRDVKEDVDEFVKEHPLYKERNNWMYVFLGYFLILVVVVGVLISFIDGYSDVQSDIKEDFADGLCHLIDAGGSYSYRITGKTSVERVECDNGVMIDVGVLNGRG